MGSAQRDEDMGSEEDGDGRAAHEHASADHGDFACRHSYSDPGYRYTTGTECHATSDRH